MPRLYKRRRPHAVGVAPGTLLVDPEGVKPRLTVFGLDAKTFCEHAVDDLKIIESLRQKWPVVWLNINGLGDANVLREVGRLFQLHPLSLEDVVNVRQRPKVESYDTYVFVVLRMITLAELAPISDQTSLCLGKDFVITFQERPEDCFESVRQHVRKGETRLRRGSADYLAYALIDAFIDHYFPILENCGERVETLQDEVLEHPTPQTVRRINRLRRDLLSIRRAIWPLRDELSLLMRRDGFIHPETLTFFRDAYDHSLRLIDMCESLREINGSLMDVYLSSVSHRMNEVMKVLTIIATIFIPLTFIAGVYGMNFNTQASPWNMPELNARWGYPLALLSMAAVGVGFAVFIWRRGWFSPSVEADTEKPHNTTPPQRSSATTKTPP